MNAQDPGPIRAATLDDVEAIRRLVRDAYSKWVPLIGREPLPMRADYARAVLDHRIDLLCEAETPVGLIETIMKPDELCPDHLWIENVAVAPERQGQGFGRRLLDHAEALAAERGAPLIRLLTNEAFASNIALYRKSRYVVTRTEPFMGGVTVHMHNDLASGRITGG